MRETERERVRERESDRKREREREREREKETYRWGARLFNNEAISDSKVNHSEDMENIIEILKNNSHVKWTIFSSFLKV